MHGIGKRKHQRFRLPLTYKREGSSVNILLRPPPPPPALQCRPTSSVALGTGGAGILPAVRAQPEVEYEWTFAFGKTAGWKPAPPKTDLSATAAGETL